MFQLTEAPIFQYGIVLRVPDPQAVPALPGKCDPCLLYTSKANSGNQRLVVMAKLLPEGATTQEFSVSLVENPEMP